MTTYSLIYSTQNWCVRKKESHNHGDGEIDAERERTTKYVMAEIVCTAIYLLNKCSTKAVQDKTPIEAWSGKKPLAKHLRVFGFVCYVHIDQKRHKLEDKVESIIFK